MFLETGVGSWKNLMPTEPIADVLARVHDNFAQHQRYLLAHPKTPFTQWNSTHIPLPSDTAHLLAIVEGLIQIRDKLTGYGDIEYLKLIDGLLEANNAKDS